MGGSTDNQEMTAMEKLVCHSLRATRRHQGRSGGGGSGGLCFHRKDGVRQSKWVQDWSAWIIPAGSGSWVLSACPG